MDSYEVSSRRPHLWSRIWKGWRSASLARLASSLAAYREELDYLIKQTEAKGVKDPRWAVTAQALLDNVQQALEDGDEALGWRSFNAAQRMELFGLAEFWPEGLQARAQMVLYEAIQKLRSWRLKAVRDLLCKDDQLKPNLDVSEVFYASQILHEHFDNVYYKLRLVRGQLASLALIGFSAVTIWFGIILIPPPLASEVRIDEPQLAFSAVLFGVMGASMSGILSLARGSAGVRIPEQLLSRWITFARFIVAAVAALVVYAFLISGLLQIGETTPTPGLILAVSFAAGFSEQLVVRAVETMGPR